jgi:signal transduction histidine kinase
MHIQGRERRRQAAVGRAPVFDVTQVQDTPVPGTERASADGPLPARAYFDCAPTATAEHDYSSVRARLEELRRSGVGDLEHWLVAHPAEVADLAHRVRILDVNAAGLQLAGTPSRAEATASLDQYFTPESLPAFARAAVTLVSGSRLVDCELAFRDKTGRTLTVVAYAAPLPGSEKTLAHVLVSFFDVTERREAERRLRESEALLKQAQKMESLGRLASGVANDFNDMLGVIIGHVDLALLDAPPGSSLEEDLRAARDAAARSTELTRQLLGFARQQPIRPRPLDLNETLAGMRGTLERLAGDRIRVELELDASLWPMLADPGQVDQVATTLVANARDAIEGTGTIRIRTGNVTLGERHAERPFEPAPGEYAMLSVTDSGAGMEAAVVRHLFEPFFTTRKAGRGAGLGLPTVYGIAKQNGGGVEVVTAAGSGTTFRIFFPRHLG